MSDGEGLSLRVRAGSDGRITKSWILRYLRPADGRHAKLTVGTYPSMGLRDARREAEKLKSPLGAGIDPKQARAAKRAVNAQALTMNTLFENWLEFVRQSDQVTEAWAKRHGDRWRLHLKKLLGNLYVRDVTRGHLAGALDGMVQKGIKEETRKALTTLNLMLDYGVTRHHIEVNPARLLKPKDFAVSANRPRDRVLSLAELRRFWAAIDSASAETEGVAKTARLSIVTVTALKLLVLTGARRGEVAGMRWDELDLQASTWVLPATRTKNRQSHTIFLSPLAVELLETLKRLTGSSIFVFDNGRAEIAKPIREDSLTQAVERLRGVPAKTAKKPTKRPIKKPVVIAPLVHLEPFTVHDLRRSAATAWGAHCKTDPHVIERMLNHQPQNKLIATYQRQTYAEEQRAAWIAWGELVAHQIAKGAENVTPITAARRAVS